MTVMIQKECLLKAARAFLVFREVEAFGEILVYRPSSQDIEDEKFEQEFSFYVASPESFDKIQNAAKNVSEIEDAVGARMLYQCTDIDIVKLYTQYILNEISI